MFLLKKIFKLPSPQDLGRSDCNALPSRNFTPDCEGYTWEDWREEVKKKYPIKYFFSETMVDFIKYNMYYPIYRPIKDTKYCLVSHLVPGRRYHILDLRQPKGNIDESNLTVDDWNKYSKMMIDDNLANPLLIEF